MRTLTESEAQAIDRALGIDSDDEVRSEDERDIAGFVGSEEAATDEVCETEGHLAAAAARFLGREEVPSDERKERRVARRKRHRQRVKEEAAALRAGSTQATTAFVRVFGAEVSKETLASFFVDKCGQGTAVRVHDGTNFYVQVPEPDNFKRALACNGLHLGAAKLSVKPALTKLGLEAYVRKKRSAATKKDAPPSRRRRC